MKYKPEIVTAYFEQQGVAIPVFEYKFHPTRKWRMDMAWPTRKIALEVDGGIWIGGRHNRGAQLKKTWEKENEAVAMGWRFLKCEPKDLLTVETINILKRCL